MALKCGIVGLPNVGKSTIFNAITAAGAEMANYPFCTIEPNIGVVAVPDPRLAAISKIAGSAQDIPSTMEFMDIAGLVKGASKGEGLGNQFLGNIRMVDAIAHVVRCFADSDVVHVHGDVEPARDIEVIDTELMLADMAAVERKLVTIQGKAKTGEKEAKALLPIYEKVIAGLNAGEPVRRQGLDDDERAAMADLFLLTIKPVLYVCNVGEDDLPNGGALVEPVRKIAAAEGSEVVVISGAIEAEISELSADEKEAFLEDIGLAEPGLNRLIRVAYKLLGLLTFFTVGPKEARAWNVVAGASAPNGAGVIHTDFEKGFIRAEVIAYDDFIACDGEAGAKSAGKMRLEGKTYILDDGDLCHFRFNV